MFRSLRKSVLFSALVVLILAPTAFGRGAKQDPNLLVQLADGYVAQNRYKEAIDSYSKAIKLDKNNPVYYQMRANAEISMAKPKQAVTDASKSLKLSPNDTKAFAIRARAYDALLDFKSEKSDLDKLIALNNVNGTTLLWRARINQQLKEHKDVIADCDQAINLGLSRDELSELYMMRAEAYKKLGKKHEAQRELAKYESLVQ